MRFVTQVKSTPFINYAYLALAINVLTIAVGLLAQKIIPPEIPLFYGLPESDSQLINSIFIVLPSSIALLVVMANTFISVFIKDDFLKKTLIISSLAVSVLCTISIVKIILLVGSF